MKNNSKPILIILPHELKQKAKKLSVQLLGGDENISALVRFLIKNTKLEE